MGNVRIAMQTDNWSSCVHHMDRAGNCLGGVARNIGVTVRQNVSSRNTRIDFPCTDDHPRSVHRIAPARIGIVVSSSRLMGNLGISR